MAEVHILRIDSLPVIDRGNGIRTTPLVTKEIGSQHLTKKFIERIKEISPLLNPGREQCRSDYFPQILFTNPSSSSRFKYLSVT
jgi:hypothetical protein